MKPCVRKLLGRCNDTPLNSCYHKLNMDPTKDQTDQPTAVSNNQDVVIPTVPSVGSPAKEVEPGRVEDSVTGKEPEVTPEIKGLRVESSPLPHDQIKITEQIPQEPATSVSSKAAAVTDPYMTEAQAKIEVKKPDKTNSFIWRALTFIRALGKQRKKQKT